MKVSEIIRKSIVFLFLILFIYIILLSEYVYALDYQVATYTDQMVYLEAKDKDGNDIEIENADFWYWTCFKYEGNYAPIWMPYPGEEEIPVYGPIYVDQIENGVAYPGDDYTYFEGFFYLGEYSDINEVSSGVLEYYDEFGGLISYSDNITIYKDFVEVEENEVRSIYAYERYSVITMDGLDPFAIKLVNSGEKHYVIYDENGGEEINDLAIYKGGNEYPLATTCNRVGYQFKEWQLNGEKIEKTGLVSNSDINVKAAWTPNTYSIVFNGNGSTSGSMENQVLTYDTAEKLNDNAFKKEDYYFLGWNTESDGSGITYHNKEEILNLTSENNDTINLFAMWHKHNYSDVIYTWNGNKCTAKIVCNSCDSYVDDNTISETVNAIYVIDQEEKDGQPEKGHYEAVFTNEKFNPQKTETGSVIKEMSKEETNDNSSSVTEIEISSDLVTSIEENVSNEIEVLDQKIDKNINQNKALILIGSVIGISIAAYIVFLLVKRKKTDDKK